MIHSHHSRSELQTTTECSYDRYTYHMMTTTLSQMLWLLAKLMVFVYFFRKLISFIASMPSVDSSPFLEEQKRLEKFRPSCSISSVSLGFYVNPSSGIDSINSLLDSLNSSNTNKVAVLSEKEWALINKLFYGITSEVVTFNLNDTSILPEGFIAGFTFNTLVFFTSMI